VLCHFTETFCQEVLTEETKRAEEERKGEKARERGQEAPLGEACLSEERGHRGNRGEVQAVAKPSEVAKPSGTPHSLIITWLAVGARALRTSRSAHESR
jgi:hypothetical protein